ncbi:CHAD domain-containing protein [Geodermatophilus africanus]|uniref:CHAD domain-containing protein n=1 Tax=Geodermatophilus africanus TaxID=1137993 RepID=A0A1H3DBH9_9ACTN|nr:CYTH and CHAD domain-containing protein [Geodermatophilus africanus]SDX63765.1 CHAD domain-containing protein [Geodermatophilus africanus]
MPAVHREVELKYAADDDLELPSLVELVADAAGASSPGGVPLADGVAAEHRLEAVYFDTADLRLAAAGLTLRRRSGGEDAGWHLKLPAGTATRTEIRLPPGRVPPGRTPRAVPDQLQSMVWARTLGRPLQPVARITTERTLRRLSDPTGQVLVEVADDRVTAQRLTSHDGTGDVVSAPIRWREIEVELGDGAGDLVEALDARLRHRGLRTAAGSKLAHVLDDARPGPRTGGKADTRRRWTAKSGAGEVVLAHIREQVAQVQAQDLPVRLDAPDAVHKMRVATRRLRSALSTFTPLFDPDVVRPLRTELKWLAGELGAARDAEVMRDRVRTAVDAQSAALPTRAGADAAQGELDTAYRTAHDRVLTELDGDRYHQVLTALQQLVEQPPLRKPAKAPAGRALPPLVERSYDRVRRIVDQARALPAGAERDELLHDARKAAKQARYAGESVAIVFGKDAATFAAAMEAVQEALGEHQDSALTRERLHALALHSPSTEVAFLYGRLHAQEEARAQHTQQRFDAAWKAAGRKSVRRWLR